MDITLDGNIKSVDFNGADVDKVTFNGAVVWEKPSPEPQIVLKSLTASNWNDSWQTPNDMFEGLGIITYTEEEMQSKELEPADAARWVFYGIKETDPLRVKAAYYVKSGKYASTGTSSLEGVKKNIVEDGMSFWYFAYE